MAVSARQKWLKLPETELVVTDSVDSGSRCLFICCRNNITEGISISSALMKLPRLMTVRVASNNQVQIILMMNWSRTLGAHRMVTGSLMASRISNF